MEEKFTKNQLEYIKAYSCAIEGMGRLIGENSSNSEAHLGNWLYFRIRFIEYQEMVPEEVRKTFPGNSELESFFDNSLEERRKRKSLNTEVKH